MSSESTENKNQIPLLEGLFTWPSDDARLIGGRCKECGTTFFPKSYQVHSPDCKEAQVEEILFAKTGILRTYTTQNYQPPPPFQGPDPFVPYSIGMVEFPEGVQIYGIMTGCEFDDLKSGMEVELVIEKLCEDELGNDMMTWKFRPVSN